MHGTNSVWAYNVIVSSVLYDNKCIIDSVVVHLFVYQIYIHTFFSPFFLGGGGGGGDVIISVCVVYVHWHSLWH